MADHPLKILIFDDEELARQKIVRYLREQEAAMTLQEATNGVEAIAAVKTFAPDLVFLDIQMPGLNGFDVLAHFEDRPFAVIFQTAFDEFAIKAFEENACDYLLKPYTRERFAKAFERACRDGLRRQSEKDLFKAVTDKRRFLENLCVEDRGVRVLLEVQSVEAMVSRDHYTCIYVGTREYLLDVSLQKLEERLDPNIFIRVHRSAIVKVTEIRTMSKGNEPEVELNSGIKIGVSRRCRGALIERLKKGV